MAAFLFYENEDSPLPSSQSRIQSNQRRDEDLLLLDLRGNDHFSWRLALEVVPSNPPIGSGSHNGLMSQDELGIHEFSRLSNEYLYSDSHEAEIVDPRTAFIDRSRRRDHMYYDPIAPNDLISAPHRRPHTINSKTSTGAYLDVGAFDGFDDTLNHNIGTARIDRHQVFPCPIVEQAYNCSHSGCKKSYKRKGDMERHARTHGPSTFFCQVDGCKYQTKGFTRKDKLHDHEKVHYRGD